MSVTMRMGQRLATWAALALLACASSKGGSGASSAGASVGPDLSGIAVTAASPAPATQTYGATVELLTALTRRHTRGGLTLGDKEIKAQSELIASRYGCVLLHTDTFEAASTGRHVTFGQVISLPKMSIPSIVVTSQTGRSACVNFQGSDGVVIEIQVDPVREKSRSRAGIICFDSKDAADDAAKALVHVATLCGASKD